jgi:hypothetical protein
VCAAPGLVLWERCCSLTAPVTALLLQARQRRGRRRQRQGATARRRAAAGGGQQALHSVATPQTGLSHCLGWCPETKLRSSACFACLPCPACPSQQKSFDSKNQTLRAVTIKQLHDASQNRVDDTMTLDGREVTNVSLHLPCLLQGRITRASCGAVRQGRADGTAPNGHTTRCACTMTRGRPTAAALTAKPSLHPRPFPAPATPAACR